MVYILLPFQSHSAFLSSFTLYMYATGTNACKGVSSPSILSYELIIKLTKSGKDNNRKIYYKMTTQFWSLGQI